MKNIHQKVFYVALYLSYALYLIAYFQITQYNPRYLHLLDIFIKYYVMIFLLIRFNPFVKATFTEFDRTVTSDGGYGVCRSIQSCFLPPGTVFIKAA